ncbi:hypothetical protein ABMB44_12845 [Levilactobacillus brevis]
MPGPGALLDIFAQAKFLAMFALLFGAGLQMLLRRGKSWIRARLSWLVLFGLAHADLPVGRVTFCWPTG